MLPTNKEVSFGCLFCRTGSEQRIAEELNSQYEGIQLLVPVKMRYRRISGIAHEESAVLFPGYIFFKVNTCFEAFRFVKHRDVYKLLCQPNGDWRLVGSDKSLVQTLFERLGVIGFSKAYFEGNRIRVTEGFLKECCGQIVRVNRRARTAQIRLQLREKELLVWLGYELIEDTQGNHSQKSEKDSDEES